MSPPESGQLVNVRSRRWVVNEVQASQLSPRPLEPTAPSPSISSHCFLLRTTPSGKSFKSSGRSSRGRKSKTSTDTPSLKFGDDEDDPSDDSGEELTPTRKGHQAQRTRSRPPGSTYPDSRNAYPADADRPDRNRRHHVGVPPSRSWQRLARSKRASQGSLPRPRLPAAQPQDRRGPPGPPPSRHPPPDHRDRRPQPCPCRGRQAWPATNPTNSSRSSAPSCEKARPTTVKKSSPPLPTTSASSD